MNFDKTDIKKKYYSDIIKNPPKGAIHKADWIPANELEPIGYETTPEKVTTSKPKNIDDSLSGMVSKEEMRPEMTGSLL